MTNPIPDPITALREAVRTVRAQVPRGELTRQSVELLLTAAEAVCEERATRPPAKAPTRPNKRQETRARWARIARQNEQEHRDGSTAAE